MDEVVTIPKSLIEDTALGSKRCLVFQAIIFSNWSGHDVDWLTSLLQYSCGREAKGVRSQIKELTSILVSKKYISFNAGGTVYIKHCEPFAMVRHSEFQKLLSARATGRECGKRFNHADAALVMSYIKMRMIHRPDFPVFYSDQISRISSRIGISPRRTSAAIRALEELSILYVKRLSRYTDKSGAWHSSVLIFVDPANYANNQHKCEQAANEAITLVSAAAKKGRKIFE